MLKNLKLAEGLDRCGKEEYTIEKYYLGPIVGRKLEPNANPGVGIANPRVGLLTLKLKLAFDPTIQPR